MEHGTKKRTASLLLAVCILIFYMGLLAVKRNNLPLPYLYPVFAVAFLTLLILRKRIFIFKRRCRTCGGRLHWSEVLYRDDPPCKTCSDSEKKELQSVPESVADIDWDSWQPDEKAVICYIVDTNKKTVLLMYKKTGLGKGKVNAPGGRIDPGETPLEAVVRECREEVHLTPKNLEKRMELFFQFTNGYALYGEAFFCTEWEGEPAESDEADPFWCDLDKIPWDKMWSDDINWLPNALKGKLQRGRYIFDEDDMLSEKLVVLEEF